MFKESIDDRISSWAQLRNQLNTSADPFTEVWEFWKDAPFIPYNNKINPFHQLSWPSPWEIIVENKYDDFTKALMIGWTIKLTKKFQNSRVEIKSLIDKTKPCQYNVVCVDGKWALNYHDNGPIDLVKVPDYFLLENLVELQTPR